MTRKLPIVLATLLVGCLLIPMGADALPKGAVGYKIFHQEGSEWVRYNQGDAFPAGGATPPTNVWKYEFAIMNYQYTSGIYQFMIFFNSDNVLRATYSSAPAPTGWAPTYFPPATGYYNWKVRFRTTQSIYYVMAPDTAEGYAVVFNWIASGTLPGPQNYDLVDATGSEAGVTHELPPDMTGLEPTTWGRVKALFLQ